MNHVDPLHLAVMAATDPYRNEHPRGVYLRDIEVGAERGGRLVVRAAFLRYSFVPTEMPDLALAVA